MINESDTVNPNSPYREKCIALGVNTKILPENEGIDYERLYNILRKIPSHIEEIDHPWQTILLGNPTLFLTSEALNSNNNHSRLIPHLVALSGNLEAIQWRVKQNSFIDKKWHHGLTMSHFVAWSGNLKAIQWWVTQYPKSINTKDNFGSTMAHYVANSGNLEAIQWWVRQYPESINTKDNDGSTMAHCVANSENLEAIPWWMTQYPESINTKNNFGTTMAHHVANSGNLEAIHCWITQHPVSIDTKHNFGITMARHVADSGNLEDIQWWVTQYPESINTKNNIGTTMAHHVAGSCNLEAIQWWVTQYPESINTKDNDGNTMAHYVTKSDNVEAIAWYKKYDEVRPSFTEARQKLQGMRDVFLSQPMQDEYKDIDDHLNAATFVSLDKDAQKKLIARVEALDNTLKMKENPYLYTLAVIKALLPAGPAFLNKSEAYDCLRAVRDSLNKNATPEVILETLENQHALKFWPHSKEMAELICVLEKTSARPYDESPDLGQHSLNG